MGKFKAIAAMSENRVIGNGGEIPWRLPDDFKWFIEMTTGHLTVMGRKTFENLPGFKSPRELLPNRPKMVLTRNPQKLAQKLAEERPERFTEWRGGKQAATTLKGSYQMPLTQINDGGGKGASILPGNLWLLSDLKRLHQLELSTDVFICGGGEVYAQALPLCHELYLTRVHRTVEGDVFFPEFEDRFEMTGIVREHDDFTIERWSQNGN